MYDKQFLLKLDQEKHKIIYAKVISLTFDENDKLFVPQPEIPESVEYTAGDGININSNKINIKISTTEGNSLTIDENGLFVEKPEIPEVEQYNVISSDSEEDFVKVDVTKNDESKQFELKTSIKTVSLFNLPENVDGLATARDVMEYVAYYVQKTLNERHPNAEVYYDDVNDTLATNDTTTSLCSYICRLETNLFSLFLL